MVQLLPGGQAYLDAAAAAAAMSVSPGDGVEQTMPSSLPPEVLQPAGLQLLQALAAPVQQLQLGGPVDAVVCPQAASRNAAAVASLTSAMTSMVKRLVQSTRDAVRLQQQATAAAAAPSSSEEGSDHCARWFPAAIPLLSKSVIRAAQGVQQAAAATAAEHDLASISSGSSKDRACLALLGVVPARSLVQLADVMEAAGPQLLYDSLVAAPTFLDRCVWTAALRLLGMASSADTAAALTTAKDASIGASDSFKEGITSGGDNDSTTGTGSGVSTSSGSQQVRWGYLLHVLQSSPRCAAAVAAFDA
ncbi:hypothetical protein COO60DRAFT_1700149 [Scenedesmus sp. NREL 46B-D3]|nr:hypothetical protein COO60DRAFT_1700149 [Scenedesmus sp. NREL 46B-D3]